jgi:hypothetical protein
MGYCLSCFFRCGNLMKTNIQLTLPILLSALVLGLSGASAMAQNTIVQDPNNPVEAPAVQVPVEVEAAPLAAPEPVPYGGATTITPNIDVVQPSVPSTDLLPPVRTATEQDNIDEANPTHPAVKLTPDKSELIRLGGQATTVLVGNPAHLTVLPEGPDTLVLIPKAPGATYFTVLNEDGKVIMQRHVIVASPKEKYVRIRKSCATAEGGCQPTQVYYCPDMCHEIILNAEETSSRNGGGKAGRSDAVSAEIDNEADNADAENSDGEETTEE